MEEVYILAAMRTPISSYGGALSTISAIDLGAIAVKSALAKSQLQTDYVQTLVMGNVLSANLGQAPARQVAKGAGLLDHVCATTVNKVCASGLKATAMVYQDIRLGDISVGIAGGMENMSQVPYYVASARFGLGYGDKNLVDGLAKDGLTDTYTHLAMGVSGDKTAERYQITRNDLDNYAKRSYILSKAAWDNGSFANEVVAIEVSQRKGNPKIVDKDEEYHKVDFDKMQTLRPAFSASGTTTAANASPLSDGASALVLAGKTFVDANRLKPKARIVAYAEAEQEPQWFTTTPVLATEKVLEKAGLTVNDIDFFEVNEAFSVVPLAFIQLLNVPLEKVNVFGGSVSLGHPLGASGARILVTLSNILNLKKGRFGLAVICNGGGGASAMIIERIVND